MSSVVSYRGLDGGVDRSLRAPRSSPAMIADPQVGQLVCTRFGPGRVTAVAGDEVSVKTLAGDALALTPAELAREVISRERALALLDRLAVVGARDAVVPSAPDVRALLARRAAVASLPEGEQPEAWKAVRDALDAWFLARAPEEIVDDVRHALAARILPRTSAERRSGVSLVFGQARSLFHELALVAGLSPVEVEYAVARGHRATPPQKLVDHAYAGSFVAQGKLVVADFCYLDESQKLLRASLQGKAGRYHAWVAFKAHHPTREHALLVVHEDALDLLASPTRKVGVVCNDAGMIGVFAAEAAADASFRAWLCTQAEQGAAVTGVTDGRGVLAATEGDGAWEVRALHREQRAVVIRVALCSEANGEDPSAQAGATGRPGRGARAYAPRERYVEGESVSHVKFGVGRVVSVGKATMEVAFADAVRRLVHGG